MMPGFSSRRFLHIAGLLLFLVSFETTAQSSMSVRRALADFPENWEARLQMQEILSAPAKRLSTSLRQVSEQRMASSNVMMLVTAEPDSYNFLFLFQDSDGKTNLADRGNVSIRKNRKSDEIQSMTILLRDSPESSARITAQKNRCVMDVRLYGKLIYRDVKIPLPIERLVILPFHEIAEAVGKRVDWDIVLGAGIHEPIVSSMIGEIRQRLSSLQDCEDGAYDQSGYPVFINSAASSPGGMNCSGFAKWVVDGFYFPLTGRYTDIERLKQKPLDYRGTRWSRRYEEERDPYFGLDWSRNLAVALEEARSGPPPASPEFSDVRRIPFFAYVEDVGFPVSDLKLILYLLARADPRNFYIGSVNQPYGEAPALRQHTHLAVLIPHFDEAGRFHPIVMERSDETSVESFVERHAGNFIHLVAVEAGSQFQPLNVAKEERP